MAASRWPVALAVVGATMGVLSAQRQESAPLAFDTVVIGRVIDGTTGQPVPGASAILSGGFRSPSPSGEPSMPAVVAPLLTDRDGRFAFRGMTPGGYSLQIFKRGYMDGAPGQTRPGDPGRSLTVSDRERADVTIRLFRYATIAGTALDDLGEPIVEARVQIYRRSLVNGAPLLEPLQSTHTNDLGEYRVANVAPGDYIVAVPHVTVSVPSGFEAGSATMGPTLGGNATVFPPAGAPLTADGRFRVHTGDESAPDGGAGTRAMAYATRYHPNAATASQARRIIVAAGDERSGIDFVLRLQPASSISGVVTGPDGPAANFVLHLVPSEDDDRVSDPSVGVAVTDVDGSFHFTGVPPGQYVIRTVRLQKSRAPVTNIVMHGAVGSVVESDRTLWAALPIAVGDADISGLSITLREGVNVRGRIEFVGNAERPTPEELARATVAIVPLDGGLNFEAYARTPGRPGLPPVFATPAGRVVDGRFTIAHLLPGRYRIGPLNLGRWSVKTAILRGVNVVDEPFTVSASDVSEVVVTMTDQQASLKFTVRASPDLVEGSSGFTAQPIAVIVFASELTQLAGPFNARRMRKSGTTIGGGSTGFTIPGGEYYVIAIPDEHAVDWQDPKVREELARSATRMSVADGEERTIELTVSNARPIRDRQ